MASDNGREFLTYDEAVAMLPDDDRIHTFLQGGWALLGADWDRDDVLSLLRTGKPELSGETATRMGHGLVAWRNDEPVFIATRRDFDNG